MQTHPRFSIVITSYNYARYVGSAIESALAQTYPNVEVVVVDDGSTDNSLEVIGRYAARHADRVRVISKPNAGYISSYNRGWLAATGELILFLDADDLVDADAAAEAVRAWRPGVVKLQYDLRIIDAAGADTGRRFCNFVAPCEPNTVCESFARTRTYRWPVTSGNVYARDYVNQVAPFVEGMGPDGLLNSVAPVYGEVLTLPRCMGSYRVHGSNTWSSNGLDNLRLAERIQMRRREVAALVSHALRQGVALAPVDLLDHELPFVNYRLMAQRLGHRYEGSEAESPRVLWWRGMRLLAREAMPWRVRLMHAAWLSGLTLAPTRLAQRMVQMRFQRTATMQTLRRALWRVRHPLMSRPA